MTLTAEATEQPDDPNDLEGRALRMFLRATRDGNQPARVRHWETLVGLHFDRIATWVKLQGLGLTEDQRAEALQEALRKILMNMIENFRGESIAEWRAYAKRIAHGAVIDVKRKADRQREHETPLEAGDEEGASAAERRLHRQHEQDQVEQAALDADGQWLIARAEFMRANLHRLPDAQREVLELVVRGHTTYEIERLLGMNTDAVLQNKSRGKRKVRQLWDKER